MQLLWSQSSPDSWEVQARLTEDRTVQGFIFKMLWPNLWAPFGRAGWVLLGIQGESFSSLLSVLVYIGHKGCVHQQCYVTDHRKKEVTWSMWMLLPSLSSTLVAHSTKNLEIGLEYSTIWFGCIWTKLVWRIKNFLEPLVQRRSWALKTQSSANHPFLGKYWSFVGRL